MIIIIFALAKAINMTLQQLEYVIALDTHRHFSLAADKCFVTQPSLSAMVQKLESELGVKIFDRSKQPVAPTDVGLAIIEQARQILLEAERLRQIVRDQRETVSGELRIGIIPTLAPYLLPLFLKSFSEQYRDVHLHLTELTTEQITHSLKKDLLDVGIMATPLEDPQLLEEPMFLEEFSAYAPHEASILEKKYLLAEDIDPNRLVLLEEGHCIRAQVINLCALQQAQSTLNNISYEAGSLETLRRLVEANAGITILPELALLNLDEDQMQYIRFFKPPAPAREISLVMHRVFTKRRLVDALKTSIVDNLPERLKKGKLLTVVKF